MGIVVNGFPLPEAVVAVMELGHWRMPADKGLIQKVFPLERSIGQALLYSSEYIHFENEHWTNETDPIWLGSRGDDGIGDIDPKQSVLIGDLGYDRPIALDYRQSKDRPAVLYLPTPQGRTSACWQVAASDIESLISALGLNG